MAIASRSTIGFDEENWSKLVSEKNRSKVVNQALHFFYSAQKYLQEKEEEFILEELAHYQKTGEHYTFDETFKN